MPCGGNRVVYTTCPNSARRVVPQATTQPVAPKVTTQKVVPAGGSIVYYSSSSGSTNGGTTYRSSSSSSKSTSKSTGGTSYHYESHSSSGGGGPGSKTIIETRSTGLGLAPQMHIDSGLSTSEVMELMKAEMDSAMLGTEKTTIIRTTGLDGGLTEKSYVERSSMPVTEISSLEEMTSLFSRLSSTQLVVIDFTAHWCGPSKKTQFIFLFLFLLIFFMSIAPVFEKLASQYPNARFFKVDVDKAKDVTQKYGVQSMPTFVFLKNKVEVKRIVGADRDALVATITKYYTSPPSNTGTTDSLEQQFFEQVTVVSKSMQQNQITIDASEMSPEMQQSAVTCVKNAIGLYSDDLAIAKYIKVTFDDTYGKYWHCIVGNAASFVSYDEDFYIRFKWGDKKITLFKAPNAPQN
ncbi:hypothetical protein WR25_07738 [Diploscapter pachys]|uniref:Dynein light chain 1, cytoplasmic n=1 Tax=Diploscapter pachys TaxID=2018661 RepID=A0A2A2L4K0_9BILA|nr:hypothetical protein WR25_07738 [Diploscapter pachys]